MTWRAAPKCIGTRSPERGAIPNTRAEVLAGVDRLAVLVASAKHALAHPAGDGPYCGRSVADLLDDIAVTAEHIEHAVLQGLKPAPASRRAKPLTVPPLVVDAALRDAAEALARPGAAARHRLTLQTDRGQRVAVASHEAGGQLCIRLRDTLEVLCQTPPTRASD